MADAVMECLQGSVTEDSYIRMLDNGEYQRLLQTDEAGTLFARYFCIGYAALLAFMQSNITGPSLTFDPAKIIFPREISGNAQELQAVQSKLLKQLSVDGVAAYNLTPNIELFALANIIFSVPLQLEPAALWVRLRVTFMHQRILTESSPTLQNSIFTDFAQLEVQLPESVELLLERANINLHFGRDKPARRDLEKCIKLRGFTFALTGLLGKRTKFQEKDTSQLVVLAKSAVEAPLSEGASHPRPLDLNDDTLLERISFTAEQADTSTLPPVLQGLDPSNQPRLHPLDSIILLTLASAITNTSPSHGLTREETFPYAERVIASGSSNWQIYTQALLVRSTIEGYKSRTTERGLLQLQALVDEVVAETMGGDRNGGSGTFLPRSQESSAPASERLRYIFQLGTPVRWELEALLAARWVALGGLKSALQIYERLEMWAEVALCWAGTDRSDLASKVIRKQLYGNEVSIQVDDKNLPQDAPRLLCILGDLEQDPSLYEKAWQVSGNHYARAQRSLGNSLLAKRMYEDAAAAYEKSLTIARLYTPTWFALGGCLMQLEKWDEAVEAYKRTVQLDDENAEAWSNLGAALLRQGEGKNGKRNDEVSHEKESLLAFQRAASLQHTDHRIWSNVMLVSTSLGDYTAALTAQRHILELRPAETSLDTAVLSRIAGYTVSTFSPGEPGLGRVFAAFIEEKVVPVITTSAKLWKLLAKIRLWQGKRCQALDAEEKAWRAVVDQPGWEDVESKWENVVTATTELCEAYQGLGEEDEWKFKACSAVRNVMGKARDNWEDTPGYERLQEVLEGLKN
ncbi:TPR-like protein [Piedraia hortae CBS 480.64]|uniref:TPR-like protein n=1 Tax=Piedraia hortae CBS 480.64 TaxID=1314780 RepID=A0A6A7BXK2_9PEZI|nr:TPR-like protein [Piedraia hortae CBS 480.64]